MTQLVFLHMAVYLVIIFLCVKPLGWYIAQVYTGKHTKFSSFLMPIERKILYWCGVEAHDEMDWKQYLIAMLCFNALGFLLLYAILRLQAWLPLNPQGFAGLEASLAFNTAISFISNTNWQAYSGEVFLGYFAQAIGLTVQNFLSAATGIAVLMAFIRGLHQQGTTNLGNYWVDLVRGVLYILMPMSLLFAVILVSQGVMQNFNPYQEVQLIEPQQVTIANQIKVVTTQQIPMGPVASQEAIKMLGSNGGGFFNTNSAHPFENPNSISNFLELMALILIPAALCYSFGLLINDRRQGWAVLAAMMIVIVPAMFVASVTENSGNPTLTMQGLQNDSNMEGKETRVGSIGSAIWATATAASASGSVNSMHDSHLPLSTIVYLTLMHIGEIVFGGLGCGLYGMIMFVIITVFIAGLMVGRSPKYLGKKIEPFEMKMVVLVVLVMPLIMLIFSAVASVTQLGIASLGNPSAHGLSEILYAFSSAKNNNGSAMAGLNANTIFYNVSSGVLMFIGRYWLAIPVLAVAGSLASKKISAVDAGTLKSNTFTFVILIVGVIVIVGALSLAPTVALGPIIEHLILWGYT